MFNVNDIYEEEGLYLCVFYSRSEETARKYCERYESALQAFARNVKLKHEGNRIVLSSPNKNLTAHVAKLLNGDFKKMF